MSAKRHSEPGCSGGYRWFACPGSSRLINELPPSAFVTSGAAEEGTLAGKDAEDRLLSGTWREDVPADAKEYLSIYVDYVESFFSEDAANDRLSVEEEVSLDQWAPGLRGRLDAAVYNIEENRLVIVDLKYGRGVRVEASIEGEPNPQLAMYALGAAQACPKWPKEVILTIVQPRQEDPIRTFPMTGEELKSWGEHVLKAKFEATQKPDAPLYAGEKQCRFCPVAPTCPALRGRALQVAQAQFDDAPAKSEPSLAECMALVPQIRLWCNAVEERVRATLQKGEKVEGFKLVESIGHRQWALAEDQCALALALFGQELYEPKLRTPAALERVAGKEMKGVIATLTHRPVTGITVVPSKDDRPALATSKAIEEFKK